MKYLLFIFPLVLTSCAAGSFASVASLYSAHADISERSKHSTQADNLTPQGEYDLVKHLKYLEK